MDNIQPWHERINYGSAETAMQAEIDELRNENIRLTLDAQTNEILLGAAQDAAKRLHSEKEKMALHIKHIGNDALRSENERLRTAAQAVIDRWDTPLWKDVPATAVFIGQLRAALGEK